MESKTAIIIGGSIAGLLTAKVISPYFSKITLLDRDTISDKSGNLRKGVAQAAHAHIFLKRGLTGLETLLPGFTDYLIEKGAVKTNATQGWQSYFPEGFLCRFESDLEVLCQSRNLLESTLRDFILRSADNIELIENAEVTNTLLSETKNPEVHYSINDERLNIAADLLVDCSGRNSKTPLHLKNMGFGNVPKLKISPFLGYATRIFKNISLPDDYESTLVMAKDPDFTRGGIVMPIEGNQYIVTLFGFSKDYPPGDETAYLAFAESLRVPTIFDAIKNAQPVSEIKQFVKKDCEFYQYSKLKKWPRGFLVSGDAITSFNPIYGQGITTTIMATEILQKSFQQQSDNVDFKNLQKQICNNYNLPWLISKNEDLRWPGTEGEKASWFLKKMHAFSNKVARASTKNKEVDYAYLSVLHMVSLPTLLLKPSILYKIFKYGSLKDDSIEASRSDKEKPNPMKG